MVMRNCQKPWAFNVGKGNSQKHRVCVCGGGGGSAILTWEIVKNQVILSKLAGKLSKIIQVFY
jgi:hypothetical protein